MSESWTSQDYVLNRLGRFLRVGHNKIRRAWAQLTIDRQFVAVASAVLILGMVIIGQWVARQIEKGVTQNTAAATALYMDGFVAPLVQELAQFDELTKETVSRLDQLTRKMQMGRRIVAARIWNINGRILYSNDHQLIGQTFSMTPDLQRALAGKVTASFNDDHHEDDHPEENAKFPLLETYAPVRSRYSDRVIAIVEFYEDAKELQRHLLLVKLRSWLLVGLVTIGMLASLYLIVRKGKYTIERQQQALKERVAQLSKLAERNTALRGQAEQAIQRVAKINENFLRQTSAELHDGPAQFLGLALLRLDSIYPVTDKTGIRVPENQVENLDTIRVALEDAMSEIRNLSTGLLLPELDKLSLRETLQTVIDNHEKRTGSVVRSRFQNLSPAISMDLKICLYRFAQEALFNAYRHADGRGQSLCAKVDDGALEVAITDMGPGLIDNSDLSVEQGLGLIGMRDRIKTLGGTFELKTIRGKGTKVSARFALNRLNAND